MSAPVGRHEEHAQLRAALAGLATGRGGLVILTGQAGTGKTHLLGRVVDDGLPRTRPPVTSAWVTAGTAGSGADQDRPLRAWSELGRALLRTRASAEVSRFCGLVEHHRTTGWTPAALDEACALAARAAADGPLLLVVDDAHRLDRRSVELLDRVLATTTDAALLVVLAGRPDAGASELRPPRHPDGATHRRGQDEDDVEAQAGALDLTALAEGLRTRPRTLRVDLGPLSVDDLGGLAEEAGHPAAAAATVRAVRASGGNPLLLQALLQVADDPDAWGRLSPTARGLLVARVREADTTGALTVLAVLDRPATTSLLVRSTGSDHATIDLALRAATAGGLVERTGRIGQSALALPVLRDAVVAATPPDRVRQVHAAVAVALGADGSAATWHRAEAARHLVATGDAGPHVALACLEAALWEERAGDPTTAEDLAVHGLDGARGEPLTEVRLLRVLGRCQARAGRVGAARETLERAVALAGARLPALEHARCVADLARADHEFVVATPHRTDQLEAASAAVATALATAPADHGGDRPQDPAADPADEPAPDRVADRGDDLRALAVVLDAMLSVALYFTDLERSRELADRARTASLTGVPAGVVTLAHDVWAFSAAGSAAVAEVDALAARWDDPDRGVPGSAGAVTCSSVGPALVRGDRGALDFALARLLHQRHRLPTVRSRGLVDVARLSRAVLDGDGEEVDRVAALVHANPSADVLALGAVDELLWRFHSGRPWQPTVATVAALMPSPALAELFVLGSLVAATIEGADGALEALRSHCTRRARLLRPRPDFTADVSLCLVGVAGGLLEDRELSLVAVEGLAGMTDTFATVAWLVCVGPVDLYLAWAHAGLGDVDAALSAVHRAETASRRVGSRPWTAQCLLLRAQLLERRDDPLAADAAAAALDVAEALGLDGVAERARRVLRGPDEDVPLPEGRLREILELAARGRTNEQIARELFISVSTVERHLSQLYRSLGVRNRAEAIARLRGAAPTTVDLREGSPGHAVTRPRSPS